MSSLTDGLGSALGEFFAPLVDAASDPDWLAILLDALGSAPDNPAAASLATTAEAVSGVVQEIEKLAAAQTPSIADIGTLLESAQKGILAVQALEAPGADPAAGLAGIGKDLVDLLAGIYVANKSLLLYRLAALLTVVDAPQDLVATAPVVIHGKAVRRAVLLPRFHPDRLVALIRDPTKQLKSFYLTPLATDADANAMADKLFPRIRDLLRAVDVMSRYGVTPEERPLLQNGAPWVDHALTVWVAEEISGATADAGASFALSPASRGDLGLVISPFGSLKATTTVGPWAIELDVTAEVDALAIGRRGIIFAASADTTSVAGKLSATLPAPEGGGPAFVFGTRTGTRLEVGGASFLTDIAVDQTSFLYSVAADVSSSTLVLAPGDGDGFLQRVLPPEGVKAPFALGLTWSNKAGLAFRGSGGLDTTLPVGLSIRDMVTVPTIHLSLQAGETGLAAEVSASVGLSIGPVQALVDRVGMTTTVAFPKDGGNLGVVDLALGFKPPSGVGLVIDTAGVSGGGFLNHDEAKQEYAGLLQLTFHTRKLTAFGLIATILPTGPGYSLIAMVDADFPPIQLGLGFMLTGAGGLMGVHRTANVDAMRTALTAHTLSNLLFPKDPIANAPQLLTELDTLFPPANGRFLFGPLARIEWGTPALLTVDLALVLELPDPIRLVLIAELTVLLPRPDEKLIEIHVSAVGAIDFGASTGSLDAVLHDSRLMKSTLHGAMALRVAWAGKKTVLLAVGGVHPKFQLPPGFPKLDRIGISMPSSGHITKLNLDGYLAITTCTLQIGAHVDIFVGVDGFGISGYLSFDTLIQRHPFHFDGDISGGVTLSVDGHDVMALRLSGSLTGPGPWHAAGSVSFDVAWWTVTKSFAETFGDAADGPPPERIDVGQLLRTALADARNFAAQPFEASGLVSLKMPVTATTGVLAHPGASLSVHQTVVPLGLNIAKYGGADPLRETRFDITGVTVDGATQQVTPVLDDFAPAQFLTLSDDDKLASPSFERLAAGVELDGETIFGAPMTRTVAYQTFLVDTLDGPLREEGGLPNPLPLGVLTGVLVDGSAGRSQLARTGKGRYAGPRHVVMPAELDFVVATSDQLTVAAVGASAGLSYSQARAALDAELAQHPERAGALLVAARYELAS